MATIFVERQIRSNPTTTVTETTSKVGVDSRRRQTPGSGVRLPAIARPRHERQASPGNGNQAASCRAENAVDRLIRRESLSSSCPELERATSQRSTGRRFVCVVKTELPSVARRKSVIALPPQTDQPSSEHVWNSPSRRLRRGCCQQRQRELPFCQINAASQSTEATEVIYDVDGDQSRSQTSFNARTMRRSVSDDALPALCQSCQADALPPLHKPPW